MPFGVVSYPQHGDTPDKVLKAADDALLRAKSEGRDRVVSAHRFSPAAYKKSIHEAKAVDGNAPYARVFCSLEGPRFGRTVMPTIHKPQLDHASFPWHEQSSRFHKELEAQRFQILKRSGFNKEFPPDAPSNNAEKEGNETIRELAGILSLAAAIKVDAGYKAANKLIATLKAIEKDPSLVLTGGVRARGAGQRRAELSARRRGGGEVLVRRRPAW